MGTTRTDPETTARLLDELRDAVVGRVVTAADPDWDEVRAVKAGGLDPRPLAVVRPLGEQDVAGALGVARRWDLPVAVRSGGHSGVGHGTVDDGVVIDVREIAAVEVDVAARTAWVGAGATTGEVAAATAPAGLAIGFGDTGSVGVSGITLGGGVGYLSRWQGLTIDNLLAAEVVLADGRVVRASADEHPDLFWALRGGGGNFGVVTRLQLRLHPLSAVTGGMLVLPATPEVVAGVVAAGSAAPEELGLIANVMPCPPMPFLPPDLHGRLVVLLLVCWAGPPEDADAVLAPLRTLADPLADLVRPVTYPELFPPEPHGPGPVAVTRTMFLDHVDVDDARRVLELLEQADGMRAVQLRPLGGAIARVPDDATAYAHRSAPLMAGVVTFVTPEDRDARLAWVRRVLDALDQGVPGAYVNFLGDEGPERVQAAYPGATWDRLREVKRTYDPGNVFARNQNVPPA